MLPHVPRRLARAALAAACLVLGPAASAQQPISSYQVDLGPPATTVAQALATRPQRMATALEAQACGMETRFLADAQRRTTGEDAISVLVAKVGWLRLAARACSFKVSFPVADGFDKDAFNAKFVAFFGTDCAQPVTFAVYEPASEIERSEGITSGHVRATFVLSTTCLKRQINQVIMALEVDKRLGSSGLPCHIVGQETEGEWDVAVRDLLRIYYLASGSLRAPGGSILDTATARHIREDLLTIDGAPAPDDYPLTGCGNTERSTGSPQDRVDERAWAADPFAWFDDVWEAAKWLFLALFFLAVALVALALVAAIPVVGIWIAIAGTIALGVAAVAAVIASFVRLPETENHLLMINTSRYLTNQIIIDAAPDGVELIVDDQRAVKGWLLRRMQSIASSDFEEYNARPYQRYSIIALLNLHDFARDDDLATASRIVLDLATAKFAAGSDGARRVVPYRRLMEYVTDDAGVGHRLIEGVQGSDYQVAVMTAYAGLTSQFPEHRVQFNTAFEMVFPATSRYAPPPAVMQVALGETPEFDQRIHHAGVEIYSRTRSFLVSAGGVRTPSATPARLGPIRLGEKCNDRGVALQTVLIPSGGGYLADPARTRGALVRRTDFLRIEGFYYHYPRDGMCLSPNNSPQDAPPAPDADGTRSQTWSHDDNVCVYRGFACGTNIVVPDPLAACFVSQPGTPWSFLQAATCAALPRARPFHVALYRRPCPQGATACLNNWGFFEAVEAVPTANPDSAFAAFRGRVLAANPASLIPDPTGGTWLPIVRGPPLPGTYVSSRGQRIVFDAAITMMSGGDAPGVRSVDGVAESKVSDWPLAAGGVINAKGCPGAAFPFAVNGLIEITGSTGGVTIDFCDWQKPKRTEH